MSEQEGAMVNSGIDFESFRQQVIADYRLAYESRQVSLTGRKEVLTGKAKFGIFGDGKEVAQIAMAKQFRNGDWRAGYYRDQTFMFAIGESDMHKFFAQLYANPDVETEPSSAGRSMNGHYGTRSLNADGSWKDLMKQKNSSSDISPTAGQMPRLLGLAWASKLFRQNAALHHLTTFSNKGNEVAFGTIGDASTSEGLFWEAINAAGVLQVPMAMSVWDDGYGISVSAKYQTTKQNISEVLRGFERNEKGEGYLIYRANGWDYAGLCEMYEKGITQCRKEHVPVLFHIQQMTQPQGHSTSGSHERYKSKERLEWEDEFDCLRKMREWMISSAIATSEELEVLEADARKSVADCRRQAWDEFMNPIKDEIRTVAVYFDEIAKTSAQSSFIEKIKTELVNSLEPARREVVASVKKVLYLTKEEKENEIRNRLVNWLEMYDAMNVDRYDSNLYSESEESSLNVEPVAAMYDDNVPLVDGREVIQANFDALFAKDDRIVAFGEDVGKIGDVNQGFAGLQAKYGELRISDTGIREATIVGQGLGLALRGLRPIAEIQYLDYLLYALETMSDDIATLQYRTKGGQKCPLIIRTRGHRLEGIWHSGSPMGMIIHALRGINILVPRNMTQAAGFYNTMLASDEPALIIECLNGYRLKEKLPTNLGEFKVPLGVPETLAEGNDVTIVTYGSCCRVVMDAVKMLNQLDISCEVIDVQTLLPFDRNHFILESVKKTNKLLIVDEDVPGGASAYILQQILEIQKGFQYLDASPRTLSAKAHRPAYGSDGDYFSKSQVEDVIDIVYEMMSDYSPGKFPSDYR
jgi:2-oxoisovalerate dehydrogenase E1 component